MGKTKENKMNASSNQNNECTTVDSSSLVENNALSDTLCEGNQSTGITQSMSSLTVYDSDPGFQIPVDTVMFYPDKRDSLFKITVKNHEKKQN